MTRNFFFTALLLGVLASDFILPVGGQQTASDVKARIEKGRAIATKNCARCHSISGKGASPLAKAPPLRDLNKRYSVRDLEEPFAEGIVTAHDNMPVFRFDPPEIDALLTFIEALGGKSKAD